MSWRAFIATWTAITLAWWVCFALHGEGPFVEIGRWRNKQVARNSLRLLNRIAYFAWDQAEDLTP